MAADKPRRAIRFELTWRGVFGVAVLVFCLFLWMFILGVWAGQTILPASGPPVSDPPASGPAAAPNNTPTPANSSSH
ncbi:MAG: hypothetical protein LBH14_04575 [Desulfobulbaceae bacterium]|nr:hypothetical protein [Desulfobulbaceae bacterium]